MRPGHLILMALLSAPALAVPLVDTGTPPDGTQGVPLFIDNSLGVTFAVPAQMTIVAVEGFMRGTYGGQVVPVLFKGPPTLQPPLYSSLRYVAAGLEPQWEVFSNLEWTVLPGTYTLAFIAYAFTGYMPVGAPHPLGDEWNQTRTRPWTNAGGVDGLGIRVHVSAVPEAPPWLLMASALAMAAVSRLQSGRRRSDR